MKKQKIKLATFIFVSLMSFVFYTEHALAGASATVSWTPPTTDQGGGALTGLTGYKVFYNTSSTWLGMVGTCLLGLGTSVNVSGGATSSYFFNNTLTPGNTYYFTVAATDGINDSYCATGTGGVTEVSKRVTYSGDLDVDQTVGIFDYNILKGVYNTSGSSIVGDINKDATVNIFDYNILKGDYGKSFT